MSVVGFDIGNESCIVAVARQRGIDVVLNDESKRETPAVVCFGDKQRFIGTAGAASTMMNPKNSITQIKRLLGRRFNDPDLQRDLETLPFTVVSSPDGFPLIHVNYRNEKRGFTPTQILAMILSDLKGIAEKNLSAPVVDCCIGVPVYFTDLQRRAVLDAATIAGLHPLRLFHETTATALGYGIYKSDLPEDDQMNVAFVDVGHASMQVCIAGFSNGQLKVLAHSYDRSLGGRDFDEVLFKHFAERFKDEYKIDVYQSPRACLRLRAACEKLKKVLSANPEAPLNIECLMDDKDVRGFIKREEFEQISSPILERVKVPLEKALAEAGLTVEDIHSIEVVGSGSRVPAIIGILRGFFGMEPRRTMNASECVARGCALQCAALSPAFRVRDFQVHESFPFPIALSWEGSILESQDGVEDIRHSAVVFPKGDPIPSTQFLTFYSCNSFSVNVMCTDLNGLNGPQIISKYSIGPVQTTKSEGAKFKVKVCLTIHGTVSVESATMLEEEIEVPVSVRHLLKNYTMLDTDESVKYSGSQDSVDMHDAKYPTDDSSSGTENGPVPEDVPVQLGAAQSGSKIKAPEKKLKNINVPFTELVFGGMTPEEVCRAKEVELSMACQDRLMEETKDKKNAVEAYVYDMRNKLHSKYHDFIAAEEMQLFCKKLQGVEDWLYEEGEDETMEVYVLMLEELVKLGNPVEERYKNWAERDPAIQEFFDVVERFRKMAYCKIRRYDHIDMEERQKIVDVCEDAEKWLSEKIEIQSSLPKYAAPVLLAADVRREAKAVYRFCQSIMSKRKPPPVNQQIPLPTERQHPQPEDTAQQPPVGDGTGDPQSDASDVESEAASDPMDTEFIKAEEGATDATLRQA